MNIRDVCFWFKVNEFVWVLCVILVIFVGMNIIVNNNEVVIVVLLFLCFIERIVWWVMFLLLLKIVRMNVIWKFSRCMCLLIKLFFGICSILMNW